MAQLLVDLLAERGGRDRVLVSSFNLASVDRVRSLAPDVRTALAHLGPGSARSAAGRGGARPFAPCTPTSDRSPALTPAPPPRDAHERGLEVNVWTVNDPTEIARLAAAGIDALITDVPDVALQAIGR